jgi:transcriptional regulator with XRE-family HTH domain
VARAEAGDPVRCDAADRLVRALAAPDLLRRRLVEPTVGTTAVGALLEGERARRGWTIARLGEFFGVSRQMASAWLHGSELVSGARLEQVAAFCHLTVGQVTQAAAADRERDRPARRVGLAIAALRAASGLTQAELAGSVGASPASVEHWEMGLRAPGARMRDRLAGQFGVSQETFAA